MMRSPRHQALPPHRRQGEVSRVWPACPTKHWSRRQQPPLVPRSGCQRGSPRALGSARRRLEAGGCRGNAGVPRVWHLARHPWSLGPGVAGGACASRRWHAWGGTCGLPLTTGVRRRTAGVRRQAGVGSCGRARVGGVWCVAPGRLALPVPVGPARAAVPAAAPWRGGWHPGMAAGRTYRLGLMGASRRSAPPATREPPRSSASGRVVGACVASLGPRRGGCRPPGASSPCAGDGERCGGAGGGNVVVLRAW